jgi:hypothetical protein
MIAYTRLPEGMAAYGAILSAMGGEVLLGMVAVAVLPKPRPERFGTFVLLIVAMFGIETDATSPDSMRSG